MSNLSPAALHFFTELRARLITSLCVFAVIAAVCLYYSNPLYAWLANPLLACLPTSHLIATQMVAPFFVPCRLAMTASMLMTVPYFLYQVWRFVAPALYRHERRLVRSLLLLSIVLFYSGIAFAYFVIFPLLFRALAGMVPLGVVMSPDMGEYLDFTTRLLLMFGCLFEIPIVMMTLSALQLVSMSRWVRMRSYAIVGAFVVGMLLAPPDVFSQTVLAIPIWLLYEVGMVFCRCCVRSEVIHA